MRWFKHKSDARRDPKMLELKSELGFAGVGMFWAIVETVAENWSANGSPEFETDLKTWRDLTGIPPQKITKLTTILQLKFNFSVTFCENKLKIGIPKLQDLKDNYTRNLQVTSKNISPKRIEVRDKDNKTPASPGPSLENVELGKDGSPVVFKVPLSDGSSANITEKTLCEWENNYRFIDARGKVATIVNWYAEGGGKNKRLDRKGWFFAVAGMLSRASSESKAKMLARDPSFDPNDPDGSKAAARRIAETRKLIEDLSKKTAFVGDVQ